MKTSCTRSIKQRHRTVLLTNKANTSSKHKQTIQSPNLNVLICFLPAAKLMHNAYSHTTYMIHTMYDSNNPMNGEND